MHRRVFLKTAGATTVAGMTVLAGCSGGNNGGGDGGSSGETATSGGAGGSGQSTTQASSSTSAEGTSGMGAGATTSSDSSMGTASGTSGETAATSSGGGGSGGTTTVKMYTKNGDYYFDPIGLFVKKGGTVTWKIATGSHSSTAYKKGNGSAQVTRIPKGAKAWDSGTISGSKTFKHTFKTEGTYDYFCIPHKSLGMVARIVVGSPGGPAEGSMPPDGKVPKSEKIVKQGSIAYGDFSQ